jgi:hypothetical protein
MLRELGICACVLPLGADIAWACPGQTGKVIFSDDFSDDSGGWDLDSHVAVASGALHITADSKFKSDGSLNSTFNATNADYCEVIGFPATPPEKGGEDTASLMFLANDYNSRYQITVGTSGEAWINRLSNGNWQSLMNATKLPDIKTDPGAENTLRVVVKDNKITFFVNGTQIKVLRAQVADAANKFGIFAGSPADNPPTTPRVYTVKSYSVTEAP